MSKNLSVKSIAEIDMQSSFELNVFATQDFNKIVGAFETNSYRGNDYEVPFSANDLVPGHLTYDPENGGQLDIAGKFIDPEFDRKVPMIMNFRDWLKNDQDGTVKLFLLSWDKKYLVIVDKFQIISWKDGTNGPGTAILTHSFRISEVPGYVADLYKRSQLRIDNLANFMNWERYSVKDSYHTKDEGNGMVSVRALPEDDVKIDFQRVLSSKRYYCVFEGEPLKIEIKSATVGNLFGVRKIHQQEINIKFETYLQVIPMTTRKTPLFFDRFGRNFAVLLSLLMMNNLKMRQNMLGVRVPSHGLKPVQNFNIQNFKGYEFKEDVSISAIQFMDIPDFQDLILRWSESEKLRVLGITLVNIWDERHTIAVRLKELVAAIEIYYHDDYKVVKTKDGKQLKQPLSAKESVKKFINEIGDNREMDRIIGDVDAFAKKLVDYRVLFTHGTRKSGVPEDATESDVLVETLNLEFIMRAFILNKLGVNLNKIITILGRQWVD
ncbi:HEPN domain-containing protein [Weissella cibaria]|uniref:HEPN domain-containing protein n=1 Tax=Weissella cibaria TaxID=137591 RepID=UPI0013D9F9C4|nr:HEPN domain-containing protein [Weissella cibaria]NFA01868.1 hypothetical protein [Weissella cibaria]